MYIIHQTSGDLSVISQFRRHGEITKRLNVYGPLPPIFGMKKVGKMNENADVYYVYHEILYFIFQINPIFQMEISAIVENASTKTHRT
jgi:hypothetical protein